jgi:hypothetical protein
MKCTNFKKFYPSQLDTLCNKNSNFDVFIKNFPYFHENLNLIYQNILFNPHQIKRNFIYYKINKILE